MEYWDAEAKATECYQEGDFAKSLEYYTAALRTIPNDYQRQFAVISLYIGRARSQLGLGDAQAAYATLEDLAKDDSQGIYMGYPEYFGILIQCQKRLGIDCRNAENQLYELGLDWMEALKRARRLLDRKQYRESLIYFERAICSNPYEWYSSNSLYDAYQGKAEALKMLGRDKEAEACLKQIPSGS